MIKGSHEDALAVAQAAVDDCVAIFGWGAEKYVDDAVVAALVAAGYEVKYLAIPKTPSAQGTAMSDGRRVCR